MKRFVVTGAAGFIGSHLCESLLEAGNEVVGIDSFTDYYDVRLKRVNLHRVGAHPRFTFMEFDLSIESLEWLAGWKVDGIFHLAAQAGVRASWGSSFEVYLRDNLLATQRIFEGALATGTRVVFASSSSVYGNSTEYPTTEASPTEPISPYGVTKLGCEGLARSYFGRGLDVIALRYFTVYGPRQRPDMAYTRIANALLRGEAFTVFGSGSQSRDVTYVGDAVAASIAAMNLGKAGAIYNVGGGSETTLIEAIRLFESVSERSLTVNWSESVAGDVSRTKGSTVRLHDDAGWSPATRLEEGIRAHFGWAADAIERSELGV